MYFIVAGTAIALYLLHLCAKSFNRFCTSKKRLDGRTVLVTGGTCGMGLQAAIDFANRGAKLIIASPFEDEGRNAQNKIQAMTGNKKVSFKFLDLASLKSVRDFSADFLENENRLDILVNNAGVGPLRDNTTADGISFVMQVNYYGHFLLTLLLLPLLKKTGTKMERSRIVNISSMAHKLATGDVTKYNRNYKFTYTSAYSNSKLSLVFFARELSKRLNVSNVVINCVDPGIVSTNFLNSVHIILTIIMIIFSKFIFKNAWEGAQTALFVALDDEAGNVSGEFFKNCQISRARPMAYDEKRAELLWNDSVRLVRLCDEEVKRIFN